MSRQIRELLDQSKNSTGVLVDLIRERGGQVIPACENRQPEARLQIASVHFAEITGVGPGLLGAATDWRRQAIARVAP